jgi:hypothetical protein
LCSKCHRSLHVGDFSIDGDPEDPVTLVFRDKWGRPIGPPVLGPPSPDGVSEPRSFIPSPGEPLKAGLFSWN